MNKIKFFESLLDNGEKDYEKLFNKLCDSVNFIYGDNGLFFKILGDKVLLKGEILDDHYNDGCEDPNDLWNVISNNLLWAKDFNTEDWENGVLTLIKK